MLKMIQDSLKIDEGKNGFILYFFEWVEEIMYIDYETTQKG